MKFSLAVRLLAAFFLFLATVPLSAARAQSLNEGAIQAFRELVEKWPEHIDANYGLSLSLKAAGQKQAASEAFQKTKTLVDAARATQSDENARYTMLARMIDQQITSL